MGRAAGHICLHSFASCGEANRPHGGPRAARGPLIAARETPEPRVVDEWVRRHRADGCGTPRRRGSPVGTLAPPERHERQRRTDQQQNRGRGASTAPSLPPSLDSEPAASTACARSPCPDRGLVATTGRSPEGRLGDVFGPAPRFDSRGGLEPRASAACLPLGAVSLRSRTALEGRDASSSGRPQPAAWQSTRPPQWALRLGLGPADEATAGGPESAARITVELDRDRPHCDVPQKPAPVTTTV
jgi:hypothetical protein